MQKSKNTLMVTILSFSLLTVMAGAAIAPALDVIQEHFSNSSAFLVQMIVSLPALFIVIGNMIFPRLTNKYGVKVLSLAGLCLYVVGGACASLIDSIYLILVMRALVGLGVGILMPLSTGLLPYYFPPSQLNKLMGYSSAMNQMGGVVATLLAGILAGISWRFSFLVYLMGLFSVILTILFLPNDKIGGKPEENKADENTEKPSVGKTIKTYWANIAAMFLLMTTFFAYATNFAMITIADGVIPHSMITICMALMDFIAFVGGLSFARIKKRIGNNTRFVAPLIFLIGYILLTFVGGWIGTIIGSVFIGFANGAGIPFLMANASARAGKNAVTSVIPLLSMALYLAQFLNPSINSLVKSIFGSAVHMPYYTAIVTAILFLVVSVFIKDTDTTKSAQNDISEMAGEEQDFDSVSSMMKKEVYTIGLDDNLRDALEMMVEKKISGMPVVDEEGKLSGFISDGDILRYLSGTHAEFTNPYAYVDSLITEKSIHDKLNDMMNIKVEELANKKLITVDINDDLESVCQVLSSHHIKKAPVLENGNMVGVINVSNLTKSALAEIIKQSETIAKQ